MTQRNSSERALASALRIKIIDHLAEIDLPGFMFEQIDCTLNELNYYKLSNLFDNIGKYTEYLYSMARKYNMDIKAMNNKQSKSTHNPYYYQQYMTNKLINQGFESTLTTQQCTILYTKYSVLCILTMKEYINRRILQSSARKQKEMSTSSVSKNIA